MSDTHDASQDRAELGATNPSAQHRLSVHSADATALFAPTDVATAAADKGVALTARAPSADPNSRRAPRPISAGLPPRHPPTASTAPHTHALAALDAYPEESAETHKTEPDSPEKAATHASHASPDGALGEEMTDQTVAVDAEDAVVAKETTVELAVEVDAKPPAEATASRARRATPSSPLSPRRGSAHQRSTFFIPAPTELNRDEPAVSHCAAPAAAVPTRADSASTSATTTSSPTTTATTAAPIDNKSRFRYLFLGLVVMLMSSTVGTFAIFGFYIQKAYAYTPEDMMNLFVIGTCCGLATTFFSGVLYDYYAQRLMVVLTGLLMVVPACVLLGLSFHGSLKGTKAQFIGFFYLLNVGAYGLDLTAMLTTVTHFPRNRGMVCGLLKTFSGLGASFFSCLYRGYLYDKVTSKNFSNLFFFLTAFIFVLGIVCSLFFKPAPWADIRFYRYARRRKAEHCLCAPWTCLHRFELGKAGNRADDDALMTVEKVESHLRRYFAAKVPYLKYRPPQRRTRITFLILLLINIYMTLQLVLVAYLEVTSRATMNGIATGALILVLLTSVLAWPLDCLDEEVNYAAAEQDINEDGLPIGELVETQARAASLDEDNMDGDEEGSDKMSPTAPLMLKPATITNPLVYTAPGDVKPSRETSGVFAPVGAGGGGAGGGASLPASHRASAHLSFSLPPSRTNRTSQRHSASLRVENMETSLDDVERPRERTEHTMAVPLPVAQSGTPMPSRVRHDRGRHAGAGGYDLTATMSQLLFAREMSEAMSMLELSTPLEQSMPVPLSSSRRSSTVPQRRTSQMAEYAVATTATQTQTQAPPPSSRPLSRVPSPLLQSQRNSAVTRDRVEVSPHLLPASATSRQTVEADKEEAQLGLENTQRDLADELMQTMLVDATTPAASRRIPVNGDTVIELIKYRSGFVKALLTPELWVLLWLSFTVWATGLTITNNLFIQLLYAAEDGKAMPNKLYYLFAALSGISIGGGRVMIGTVADDLLPSLRRKHHRPFGLSFTLLLIFPPWATVLGLIFFMAIPGPTVQILGQLFVAFAYGLTTSAVPYAVTVFFSFEYVGLGKIYGLCLLAVGAGVAVLYRAAFALTYLSEAYPVGVPTIPAAAWGMCLKGKKPCTLDFFVVCLVLNVVAGVAAVYLHLRFQSRLRAAAREQIDLVEAQAAQAEVDVAYLHEWTHPDGATTTAAA